MGPTTIVSYLTPLTGLSKLKCTSQTAKPLSDVMQTIKDILPIEATLIGQSIQHDIDWLGLEKGVDFKESFDISILFRQRISCEKYRVFSLRHTCKYLLDIDIQQSHHDPVQDAIYSLKLFQTYKDQSILELRATRDTLHRAPHTLSFKQMTPVIDGV